MSTISVVIPTYNGQKLLENYLPSLYVALAYSKVAHEVIVVDDASTDDTIAFLHTRYPEIISIKQEANKGFAATINHGIASASCDLVCCLNNDMEVAPDFFLKLLPYFDLKDTFGVMSSIYNITKTKQIESIKMPMWQFPTIKIKNDRDIKQHNYSFFICGGNGLFDRKKLQSLGGFSRLYEPCYYEDVDLSARAWSVGWKSYCDLTTACYHMHSATFKSVYKQYEIERISYRNKLYFNYLFTTKEDKPSFIKAINRKKIYYQLAWWKKMRKAKRQAIKEFMTTLDKVDKADKEFDDFCLQNNHQRTPLHTVINTYFS